MAETEPTDWEALVRGIVKAELKRRNVSYQQLAERLREMDANETTASITNKLSRGRFTAVFFVQCLRAMGCQTVRLVSD